jgi:cytochrome c oxidase subunit III
MEIPYTVKPRPDTGLYNAKVGIWLFLASEVMLFGALFSSYILLRVGAPDGFWPDVATAWPHGLLNIPIGTFNTAVLIVSSVTVVMAWTALKEGNPKKFKKFMTVTLLCALGFLSIKSYEYNDKFTHYVIRLKDGSAVTGHLDINGKSPRFWTLKDVTEKKLESIKVHVDVPNQFRYPVGFKHETHAEAEAKAGEHEGGGEHVEREIKTADISFLQAFVPATGTFFAIYFTMTFLHGLHVLGGALVMAYMTFFSDKLLKSDPERFTNRIEVAGLFWHFVDLVWIFLFPVVYLL